MNFKTKIIGRTLVKEIDHDELVFVFGSNLAGIHGKGAANTAKRFFGAKEGKIEGVVGDTCYALPTKDSNLKTLPMEHIERSLITLFDFASKVPTLDFMLTKIGCGLAGIDEHAMLTVLSQLNRPDNVLLCGQWQRALGIDDTLKIIVAGGRGFNNYEMLCQKLDALLVNVKTPIEIICGEAKGADLMGKKYAIDKNSASVSVAVMKANWNKFGKPAGMLRNSAMAWYANSLVAFWDGQSRGTKNMIDLAKQERLAGRVVRYQLEENVS